MSKYIDLVLATHSKDGKKFLFQAPRFSGIKPKDELVVETVLGRVTAMAVCSVTVDSDSDMMNFAVVASGATLPLKKVVSARCYYDKDLVYEDEGEKHDTV